MIKHSRNLLERLSADKRVLSIAVSLFAVGMLFWGRLRLKEIPKTAVADPEDLAIGQVSAGDTDGAPSGDQSLEKVVIDYPMVIDRDVFRFDPSIFRRDQTDSKQAQVKLEKVGADKRKALPADVREKIEKLQLQSITLGTEPKAMINGQLLSPGQVIGGFTLERVNRRSVIMKWNGYEIQIEM